jgi:methenyltetrahydrofolate cyclohydrolase
VTPTTVDLLELRVTELLEGLADTDPVPAGGSAAAFCGAMAASLVSMAARSTDDWDEAGAASAQALALRARLEPLALADAEAYAETRRAFGEGDTRGSLARALDRAAELPLTIAEATADVAELGAQVYERCDVRVRGDALAAVALAAGATKAAGRLVEINLATTPEDQRARRADALSRAASEAWARTQDA